MVDFSSQQLNNRLLRGNERVSNSKIARWISVGVLVVTLTVIYAWLQMEILNIHYHVEQTKTENHQLRELGAALRAEYSSLIDPQKIGRRARQLGMIHSNRPEVQILTTNPPFDQADSLVAEWRHVPSGSRLSEETLHE